MKIMSKDIKWSESVNLYHVWVEDLEDPHLSAFCEDDGGVYFVIDTSKSMGNFSDVNDGILKIHKNPELLQIEIDSLVKQVDGLREALEHVLLMQTRGHVVLGDAFTNTANKALKECE